MSRGLTASQELLKEMQRQDKAKLLPGGSQTLIRVAQKHELARTQLAALGRQPAGRGSRQQRRFSDVGQGAGGQMLLGRHDPRLQTRRVSCLPNITTAVTTMPTISQAHYLAPPGPKEPLQFGHGPPAHSVARPEPVRVVEPDVLRPGEEKNTSVDSNETLKDNSDSEVLEDDEGGETGRENDRNLDLVKEEDKPMENAEWCEFLDSQLEEMLVELDEGAGCLDSVDNQTFLAMLLGPLQNSKTDSVVVHKLCQLLSLPLATQKPDSPAVSTLLQAFHTKRLVHYLVVALTVQARQSEEEEGGGLVALTCFLLRLATSSQAMGLHLQQAFASQARQEILVSLLERQESKVVADVLAILSRLVSRQDLGKVCLAAIPGKLKNLLTATRAEQDELVLSRAFTLLCLVAFSDPEACRPHISTFQAACKQEGRQAP